MPEHHGSSRRRRGTGGSASQRSSGRVDLTDEEWRAVLRRHYRRRKRQKLGGAALAALGLLVILNHYLEHTDALDLLGGLFSPSAQDLVAGFPLGIMMLLAALILIGQSDQPPQRTSSRGGRRP